MLSCHDIVNKQSERVSVGSQKRRKSRIVSGTVMKVCVFISVVVIMMATFYRGEASCGTTYLQTCVIGMPSLTPTKKGRVASVQRLHDCASLCNTHRDECVAFDITREANGTSTCQLIKARQYTTCLQVPNTKHFILDDFCDQLLLNASYAGCDGNYVKEKPYCGYPSYVKMPNVDNRFLIFHLRKGNWICAPFGSYDYTRCRPWASYLSAKARIRPEGEWNDGYYAVCV